MGLSKIPSDMIQPKSSRVPLIQLVAAMECPLMFFCSYVYNLTLNNTLNQIDANSDQFADASTAH